MHTEIISIASQKGGTGKSTTTLNLGYSLASLGNRVLIIDGDPQGGMSLGTNIQDKKLPGLVDIILDRVNIENAIVSSRNSTLSAIGSGEFSTEILRKLESESGRRKMTQAIKSISTRFDYVLLDCPAGMGSFVKSFLSISNSVIIPLNMRNTSVRSLPVFLQFIDSVRNTDNPSLIIEGILVTMLDYASRTELDILKSIKESFPRDKLLKTVINHDYVYEEISIQGVTAAMSQKATKASRNYFELALELNERKLARLSGDENEELPGLF